MAGRRLKIGLLWHSANSGNLGVGALTLANMAIARQVAHDLGLTPEFTIVGMGDEGPSYVSKADASVFVVDRSTLLSPTGCWALFGKMDCVLDIGAGDSFADIYGPKRFAFLWLTKLLVLARGKPLVLSPQTIGPFSRFPYRQLARMALNRATAVVARDVMSFDALRKLAPGARGALAVDVAFALPFEDRHGGGPRPKVRVGVNVSGLLFNEAVSGRNRFRLGFDYARLMRAFIAELCQRDDVEVVLLTHANDVAGGSDDDDRAADVLAREFPAAHRAPSFSSPIEAKSFISGLDFLVAGRMHACIAAYSAGVAVVPISYSRKFSGLFGMLGYEWLTPVNGMNEEQAISFLLSCLAQRDDLQRATRKGMEQVDRLLEVYRAELRKVFLSAAS
jgi:colanic acid/amylovoran biosynthesis protein